MSKPDRQKAAEIVRDAGGTVVGRTKLQKVGYLLELAGFGEGFRFEYRHYGPFSEDLAAGIELADAFGLVTEEEKPASWGGHYSTYRVTDKLTPRTVDDRVRFAETAARFGSIELELAATAAYLKAAEGIEDPWEETAKRKPEKCGSGRLERAKDIYRALRALPSPTALPDIA